MKADTNLPRSMALGKRLLQVLSSHLPPHPSPSGLLLTAYDPKQVSAHAPASFACGALLLLSEVMKAVPGLDALFKPNVASSGEADRSTVVEGTQGGMLGGSAQHDG